MISIAVVILNWNGRHYLQKFLPSVCKHSDFPGTEIIVADNGSDDDSVQFLKDNYPQVRIIEFSENYGFAMGYHKALDQIEAVYFMLLNSDVEVTPGWLVPLYNAMESDQRLGACMPKVLSYDRKDHFEYAGACGGFIDRFGYPFCRGRILSIIEKDSGQYEDQRNIFWATGACMFLKADAYKTAGGLDGEFFAHMEEIDLCWRMHRTGYNIAVVPLSKVFHVGGGTLPNNTPRKLYLNYRNNLILLFKNLPAYQLIPVLLLRMVLDGMSGMVYLADGSGKFFFAVFRAHFAFYRRIPLLLKTRRQLKGTVRTGLIDVVYPGSIIFDFFIRRKHHFSKLNW
ncbi:MAG TPA: glycosyltransferase family 2 protein [Bacteroidales bacterium]|nr:glycosyltransferase family 2 protein [Bacteroidales bacterium]